MGVRQGIDELWRHLNLGTPEKVAPAPQPYGMELTWPRPDIIVSGEVILTSIIMDPEGNFKSICITPKFMKMGGWMTPDEIQSFPIALPHLETMPEHKYHVVLWVQDTQMFHISEDLTQYIEENGAGASPDVPIPSTGKEFSCWFYVLAVFVVAAMVLCRKCFGCFKCFSNAVEPHDADPPEEFPERAVFSCDGQEAVFFYDGDQVPGFSVVVIRSSLSSTLTHHSTSSIYTTEGIGGEPSYVGTPRSPQEVLSNVPGSNEIQPPSCCSELPSLRESLLVG